MAALEIRTFISAAFDQNAYLLWKPGSTSGVAIDPGADAERMADALSSEGLWLEAILLTHAHLDHIEGVARLVRRTGAATHLHAADRPLYDRVALQAARFGMEVEELPPIDHALQHGQVLDLAGTTLQVRHVPGHSPGHVILYVEEAAAAFVGDVIFAGSIGRTDLPGGNFTELIRGIREQVFTLPDATTLHPGHGPPTTVAHERATNPFLVPQFGGGLA